MGRIERTREIAQRRKRRKTLAKLRKEYSEAKTEADKLRIFAKARRVSPFVEFEETTTA
ncbi:hypothetical protein MNBD_PLANCTO02-2676 [hydrothermal vent metagenome]|uniref:Uncharacterized protein n=1 Tax=hydrothermal vent metagenome TaxID=652676 RepID=A0A3B1E7L9_9ZZZZ